MVLEEGLVARKQVSLTVSAVSSGSRLGAPLSGGGGDVVVVDLSRGPWLI